MDNLSSVFQLISTNDLEQIQQHLDVLRPYLSLTLDIAPNVDGDDLHNFTWHNAGGTFLHIENLLVPVARFLLKSIPHANNENQKELLEKVLNVKNARSESALHIAAEVGNVEMVMLLLDYGADMEARNAEGRTPLHCAVSYDASRYSESNAILTVFVLTRHDEETSANNAKNNIYEDVQCIDIRDKYGDTALNIAQNRNAHNLVKALEFCRTRCTVEHELMQNIHGARKRELRKEKYEEIIGSLAGHHGSISVTFKKDANGMTVVHIACLYGLDVILETLFRNFTVKIRVIDNEGRTPFHCAVLSENLEGGQKCLDILLREDHNNYKSAKDVRDKSGKTALRIAVERNLIPACTSLLAYGCDIYDEPWTKSKDREKQDLLFQIYNKMPSTIVQYLDSCGGYIDYHDDTSKSEEQIIGQTRKSKPSELFYTFSPLIGMNNYTTLKSARDGCGLCGLQEETTYMINLLKFTAFKDKTVVMHHPLVKLFIDLKWKKLRCMFYSYQILSFMMLLLYSWFIFEVYTISCPYKDANSTAREDRNISFRSGFFYDEPGEVFYPHGGPGPGPYFGSNPNEGKPIHSTRRPPQTGTMHPPPLEPQPKVRPQIADGDNEQMPTPTSCVPMHSKFIAAALIIHSCYIVMKEFCQLYYRDIFYGYNTKLWQLADGALMAVNCGSIFVTHGDELKDWQYTVAGFGLCVSWIILIHQIGKIPQAGKYVSVLKTVTRRSVWLLLTFLPLLIAFTFTFKILLPGNQQFWYLPNALVKSVVMMSGELDYNDLFYNPSNVIRSPCSLVVVQIFFGLFIFIMPIILLNLLIGLAVTEIKVVVQQGRTHHLLVQLEQIAIMEKILFWISKICRKIWGKRSCSWIANFLVVDEAHVDCTVCREHKMRWTRDFYSNAEIPHEKLRAKVREICQKSYYSSQY